MIIITNSCWHCIYGGLARISRFQWCCQSTFIRTKNHFSTPCPRMWVKSTDTVLMNKGSASIVNTSLQFKNITFLMFPTFPWLLIFFLWPFLDRHKTKRRWNIWKSAVDWPSFIQIYLTQSFSKFLLSSHFLISLTNFHFPGLKQP